MPASVAMSSTVTLAMPQRSQHALHGVEHTIFEGEVDDDAGVRHTVRR